MGVCDAGPCIIGHGQSLAASAALGLAVRITGRKTSCGLEGGGPTRYSYCPSGAEAAKAEVLTAVSAATQAAAAKNFERFIVIVLND
ncbi:MAG: hypothetical protein ABS78_21345 [Phenylobacterium sp. SCN 70-31]|nr:MAG: hypothetical protein ABS78_21345 [Phenylobacterium sp. SCN 70-31]